MNQRTYRVVLFKKLASGEIYGVQSFIGNLDRSCKRLVKKFGLQAPVRALGRGRYSVNGGAAELEVVR